MGGGARQLEVAWPHEGQHPAVGPPSFMPWESGPAMPPKRPQVGWHGPLDMGREDKQWLWW